MPLAPARKVHQADTPGGSIQQDDGQGADSGAEQCGGQDGAGWHADGEFGPLRVGRIIPQSDGCRRKIPAKSVCSGAVLVGGAGP